MKDPIAYFLTWTTYGTWLPGDQRGWFDGDRRVVQAPDPLREEEARRLMTGQVVVLTAEQRELVDAVLVDHCRIRHWHLHARNVRTNHVHVVVSASGDPRRVREQLKAWASRRLSAAAGLRGTARDGQRRWWTEKGDIAWLYDEDHLAQVMRYVLEMQSERSTSQDPHPQGVSS